MTIPSEEQWLRVEEIAADLGDLDAVAAAKRIDDLRQAGEPGSVLSLVGRWLSLPIEVPPLRTGAALAGRYILREKIGEGGMGSVWRATHEVIGHDVALKMIHPALAGPDLRRRFKGELEMLGRLAHPGIVRIVDAGFHLEPNGQDIPYYAMELVDGIPLSRWAAEHRADRRVLLKVASEICAAVQHAHDRKIIHRDLKPSNILVRPVGTPVVLDFGVARLTEEADEGGGLFSGTPQYAAPEQHLGIDRDFRSGESVDVYAIGTILFEMLTGRRLFLFSKGTPIAEMARTIIEGKPPRLAEVMDDCPPLLDEVIARAVRRNPADRYYSIGEFIRALNRAAATLVAPPVTVPPPWMPEPGALVPGTQWRLNAKLGEGSSGTVWSGLHEQLGERRVFKFCDDPEKVRTLKRELTLYRLLKEKVGRNPHFIPLHEVSLEEPPWYLMMDYVDASDLATWCESQPGGLAGVALKTRVEIVTEAAEALQAAHESGILHRDIKPTNILVRNAHSSDGSLSLQVFVADFGIGQIVAEEVQRGGTMRGFTQTISNEHRLSGTLLYMAPELIAGGAATARSDIYSLGVILWQLLSANLRGALDVTDWPTRITDPLLRQDLMRCLAGQPEVRWASAGELAASLRALPQRRSARAETEALQAARERSAYLKGIVRTASIAAVILAVVIVLAVVAWHERTNALQAKARGSLEQAGNLLEFGNESAQRQKGLALLEEAAKFPADRTRLRSLAAGFLSRAELVTIGIGNTLSAPKPLETGAAGTAQAVSATGKMIATGAGLDDLNGIVTLTDAASGNTRGVLKRKAFPWVPIPEPEFLQFSPDEKLLAVAGPETSMQILFCKTETAELYAYLYVPSRLQCMSWHPGGRILATGGADRTVRLWDLSAIRDPRIFTSAKDSFDLPPDLSSKVIDLPLQLLHGSRGRICSMAFNQEGTWLAALDDAGWLRIWSGFNDRGIPNLPPPGEAANLIAEQTSTKITPMTEIKLDRAGVIGTLSISKKSLLVTYPDSATVAFEVQPGIVFRETWIAPGIRKFAWGPNGQQICAITARDVFLLALDRPGLPQRYGGLIAADVAYDPATDCWVLPTERDYILRKLTENASNIKVAVKMETGAKNRGFRLGMSVANSGRTAVYFARRLRFFQNGNAEPKESSAVVGDEGTFHKLLWDSRGSMATLVYATDVGLRAENFDTSGPVSVSRGYLTSEADQLVSAEDGHHLVERGTETGISLLRVKDGRRRVLDSTSAARQDAPLAVSRDGKWIAAVFDQYVIRLIDATTGINYAELKAPRQAAISYLAWDAAGSRIAATTIDGYLQVWSLAPWHSWLKAHDLVN